MVYKPVMLSEARRILENDLSRTTALLEVLEVLENVEAAERDLERAKSDLVSTGDQLERAQARLAAFEAGVPARKKAADDEVAAERTRLQQELGRARDALAETQRLRREEQDLRERESRAHREQQSKWVQDDVRLRDNIAAVQAKEKEALKAELAELRRQATDAKAEVDDAKRATRDLRELAERITQATA